mmetsp:Transcript_4806/g.9027  ORF Transcript_4806/g.9027 Transcript_4806/m.9027 type:complete len:204 (-) Transcript_4806:1856-2467(-)
MPSDTIGVCWSSCSVITISSLSDEIRLADRLMLMAVSTLSPVISQKLILASRNKSTVCGTPSWRRSSTAVTPRISRSRSISEATLSNSFFCTSPVNFSATEYCSNHLSSSCAPICRWPTTRVRNPDLENSCKQTFVDSKSKELRSAAASIWLSAPLQYNVAVLGSSLLRYKTDIRFRVLEKGFTTTTSHSSRFSSRAPTPLVE